MAELSERGRWLLAYMHENSGCTNTYDYEAEDAWRAAFYPDTHDVEGERRARRAWLRTLRELVRAGHITAGWIGTGWGGRADTGCNRARCWSLRRCGPS